MSDPSSQSSPETTPGIFPLTQWSLIRKAAAENELGFAGKGLEELCVRYRPAVIALLRTKLGGDRVEDVAQDFFLSLLRRHSFADVSADQGRFRTWMRGCLKLHLAEYWRKEMALKRGGGVANLSMAELEESGQTVGTDWATPDRAFDQAWLQQLVASALNTLQKECDARGHGGRFLRLQPSLLGDEPLGQDALATELNMNADALRSFLFRLRSRLRELLREAVAQTLDDPSQAEDELQQLAAGPVR